MDRLRLVSKSISPAAVAVQSAQTPHRKIRFERKTHRRSYSLPSFAYGYMLVPRPQFPHARPSPLSRADTSPIRQRLTSPSRSESPSPFAPASINVPFVPLPAKQHAPSVNTTQQQSSSSPLPRIIEHPSSPATSTPFTHPNIHPAYLSSHPVQGHYTMNSTIPTSNFSASSRTRSLSPASSASPSPLSTRLVSSSPSANRLLLLAPHIAAHLKRGGSGAVKSVDGRRSWRVRLPRVVLGN